MIRVLHIARFTIAPVERRVALMAAVPGVSFSLVRPHPIGGKHDGEHLRRPSAFAGLRHVRVWRVNDPHRALYQTVAFGMRLARPDIVHAEEEPDSIAALQILTARRLFAPAAHLVLNTCQNVDRRKKPWVSWVLRQSLAAADAVACINVAAAPLLRAWGFRGPTPVIPNLQLDGRIYHRRNVPRLSDDFTVAFVGRLAPEKGLDTLVQAVALLGPPALLVLAGSGPCRAALEAQARGAGFGDRVRFTGELDLDATAELMSASDVLVLPSRSTPVWKEQFGRVLVEAMGCEVPVVGSDSGAIPEVLDGSGLLFPENDAAALAGQLRRLRESPELRRALGRRGHEHVRREHTPEKRAAETIAFYRELLARPKGPESDIEVGPEGVRT